MADYTFLARNVYENVSGGQLDFPVNFPYLLDSHVHVYTQDATDDPVEQVEGEDFEWSSASLIHFVTAPTTGLRVIIRRITPNDNLIDRLSAPATLNAAEINVIATQLLYIGQEVQDAATEVSARSILFASYAGYVVPAAAQGVLGFSAGLPLIVPLTEVISLAGGQLYDYGTWSLPAALTDMGAWS